MPPPDHGAEVAARPVPKRVPAARPTADPHGLPADTIAQLGDDPDFVTALARGLAVLLSLSDKRRRMSIAQVAHLTGIPRAAARRSLHTLAKLGFVAIDDARRFYLRPRVLSFSHAYLSSSPIAVLAQPILDRLGEALHEAVSLAVLDGDEIVYVARASTSRIMSPSLNVGRRLPAYCTSIGHVLLAHLPDAEFEAYLARARLHPYTEHTPTSPERLRAIARAVREHGYAFASQLMEARLSTLAVPVRDAGGHYVAGINVIVQGRLTSDAEMAERYLRPMQRAALELGSLLLP
ncbi:MAG: helix-turn-helix domain-containing protein [Burkholderiales bacterium]|nr:helix-turn-helix domain-containing protein [Burkholderiales bacterium]